MSQDNFETNAEVANTIKCKDCGANLKYSPGAQSLACEYCQAVNEITVEKTEIVENDYNTFLSENENKAEQQTVSTVKCSNCGANTTLPPNVSSCGCPYCDTPLVVKNASPCSIIKPSYLLPFKIDRNKSRDEFIKWVASLWFAPNKLKQYAEQSAEKLKGIYMPYWTYDSETSTSYSGLRGDYYYVTQTYTDSNGNTQTRSVQHTRWSPAHGNVDNNFDDLLICASNSLPEKLVQELEPWDLNELIKYDDKFLAGFLTETYQIEIKSGFEKAKIRMESTIRARVRSNIGGDTQQITNMSTNYDNITFKHILLPLWISAYKYNDKVFRFTVNARTGEVQGERPYSVIKIVLFVLMILAIVIGGISLFIRYS